VAWFNRAVVAVSFVLLFGQLVACDRVQQAIVERAVDRQLAESGIDWLAEDAMHVVLCGTGSPLLDRQRAGPCTAVIAGGMMFLVDVGPGSTERSLEYGLPLDHLEAIVLTHFHSDHIAEVGEAMTQSWIAGRTVPLNVYGPTGVSEVVGGFLKAYSRDQIYRTAHHSEEFMPMSGARMQSHTLYAGPGKDILFFDKNGLRISAIEVEHAPVAPAYGYRFEYKGRSVVVSGDTDYSENLARGAKGADLLVHEVLAKQLIGSLSELLEERGAVRRAKLAKDVLDYHTSPADAVKIARAAEVDTLVFTHIVPSVPGFIANQIFMNDLGELDGMDVVLGADGMHFTLPASGGIERRDLD
jgi:ribonuclease Z